MNVAWDDLEPDAEARPGRFIHPDDPETWAVEVDREWPVVVYRFYDAEPLLLYVGISNSPTSRFKSHSRKAPWWPDIARVRIVWCSSRKQALREEARVIRTEGPIWNQALNETGFMWSGRR